MKHDNHHRRKTTYLKSIARRTPKKVPKARPTTDIRRVSGNDGAVSPDTAGREDGWEPCTFLRRAKTHIGSAIERIRESFRFKWNLRTCEITWREMEGLYDGDVHALQTSTAMYAYNKLIKAGFDMNLPIHCDQDMNTLSVVYHQYTREELSSWMKRKAISMWRYFLEH